MKKKIIPLLIGVTLACVAGVQLLSVRNSADLTVSGMVEADRIRVGSRVGGRVAEVLVREGDHPQKGDMLLRLEAYTLEDQLKQAEAEAGAAAMEFKKLEEGFRPSEVEQARASRDRAAETLKKLKNGPRPAEIGAASEQVRQTRAGLDLANLTYGRMERLAAHGAVSVAELDSARKNLKAASAENGRAEQQLRLLEEGTRSEDVAAAEAALREAEAALRLMEAGYRAEDVAAAEHRLNASQAKAAAARQNVAELSITAPVDCVVETLDLHPGDLVAANAPVASLYDLTRPRIRAFVPEANLGRLRLGVKVPVRLDALPGRKISATVSFIAAEGEFTPRNVQTPEERSKQAFRILLDLDPSEAGVRPGMLGDVLLGEAVR